LLSERESIFATHYLPSDGNDQTPRLLAAEGADDVANLPQDLNAAMEVAVPISPPQSPISLKTLFSPRKLRSPPTVKNVGQTTLPNPSTASTKLVEKSRGTIHTVHRVTSEGQSGKQIPQVQDTDQNRLPMAEHPSASIGAAKMSDVGDVGGEKSGRIPEKSQTRSDRGSAMRETFRQTGSKDRSSSRGRTHVEKSIEATLPNREPAKNVRTRKSSHLMGIFKETAPPESKKRDGQSRIAKARLDKGGETILPLVDSEIPQLRSQSALSRPSLSLLEDPSRGKTSAEVSDRPLSVHFGDLPIYAEPNISAALSDTSTSSPSTPVSPTKTEHDPYFRKRDEMKHSMSDKRPVIPAKLLEDIRKHHNLAPMADRAATLSYSLPLVVDVEKPEQPTGTEDIQAEDAEDREDEDEEHISSAVYFPHPGPSDEDIEHFTSPDEGKKAEPFPDLPVSATPAPRTELKRTLSDTAPPEHIDISVKSKHEKSVFHGDYRPAEEVSEEDVERKPPGAASGTAIDSVSSASESEISSGEELSDVSQAEGEVTPTSTPVPKSLLQRRKRTLTTAGPKGAVVLEPYSHQVGGHSTMFRFSRRAVCKQLNNRENEFYERIEQRHPDMLRFLPRLVANL